MTSITLGSFKPQKVEKHTLGELILPGVLELVNQQVLKEKLDLRRR